MQRTLSEKVADIKSTYEQYRELLTAPELTDMDAMTMDAAKKAAESGDIALYSNILQTALGLRRVLSANDRAALMAATMTNSGSTRVIPLEDEG